MYVNEHVRDILNRAKNLNGTSLAKGKKKTVKPIDVVDRIASFLKTKHQKCGPGDLI